MSTTTVTRADLVEAVSRALDLRRRDCASLLGDTLEVIANRLAAGEGVTIMNFGAFSVRRTDARLGRNPRTGEAVPIAARRVVRFRPARRLRTTPITPRTSRAGQGANWNCSSAGDRVHRGP